jgi:hypothetical protein
MRVTPVTALVYINIKVILICIGWVHVVIIREYKHRLCLLKNIYHYRTLR